MSVPVCLDDFEKFAAAVLSAPALANYRSGAGSEQTLAWNRSDFDKYILRPRTLRDVSTVDLSTNVLGSRLSFPVGIAPSAMHGMAHPDGEKATIRAASAMNSLMILSTHSTASLEEVAATGGKAAPLWFQLYIYKDRRLTEQFVRRAEAAGYSALVLTVDTPVWGFKRAEARSKFDIPPHLKLGNFETRENSEKYLDTYFETRNTTDDIRWLMSFSKLPIVVKGILSAEDAKVVADLGVAGIIVSNHGGRQLDSVSSSIDALAEVITAVSHRPACEIYMDGGIRTGSDVLKALILGARAVFIGRPLIWALAYSGEAGAVRMLQILKEEVRVGMTFLGAKSVAHLEPTMIGVRTKL